MPKSHQDMVAAVFRTIFSQPDADTVAATWDQVCDQLGDRFPKGAVFADTRDEWQAGDRRYLSDGSMATLYPERDTGAVAELNTTGD